MTYIRDDRMMEHRDIRGDRMMEHGDIRGEKMMEQNNGYRFDTWRLC